MISVDRENRAGLIKLLKDAKQIKSLDLIRLWQYFQRNKKPKQKLRKFKSGTENIS